MLDDEEPILKNEIQQSPYDYDKVLLLSFFLGVFGAHRFYVGRRNSAIVMLILAFVSCGVISLIWNTVDFVKIFLEKFKDANHLIIKSEKGNPVKGVLVFFICLVFVMFVLRVIYWTNSSREIMSKVESSLINEVPVTSQKPKVDDTKIEMIPYEFNQSIEIVDRNGENTGTIIVKSARMVMGEKAMVEVTYEITKKTKNFTDGTALYTFNGSFLSPAFDDSKNKFSESHVSDIEANLLGIKNNRVKWDQELEGTTLSVRKYYEYKSLKENFIIAVLYFDKKQIATINLNPLVENKTLDLSVVNQQPVTEQANVVVPLGEEKRVSMIDIKVNRSKIGKGKDFLAAYNYSEKDENYIILDVDIKNNSAVTLTEKDIFGDFKLLGNTLSAEEKYFIWNEKLEVVDETLYIKPGESKKVAFAFRTYEESLKKEKNYYFAYNPHHIEEEKLTKFSIEE